DLYNLHFAEGTCDVILGIPDGFGRGLNTLTYYNSPYVIAYRADAGFEVESLDDPILRELRIGIHGLGTPPHTALVYRNLLRNITGFYGSTAGSDDRLAAAIRRLAPGPTDAGSGRGPATACWAAPAGTAVVGTAA